MSNVRKNRSRGNLFQRVTALFMALVLTLGLLPSSILPAYAAFSWPKSVKLVRADYSAPGSSASDKKYQRYNSPTPQIGRACLHSFFVDVNGQELPAFCMNHEKGMDPKYEGQKWAYKDTNTGLHEDTIKILEWYMWHVNMHNQAHADTKTSCSSKSDADLRDGKYGEQYKNENNYYGKWELEVVTAWVQVAIWLDLKGVCTNMLTDSKDRATLIKERQAVLKYLGFTATNGESVLDDIKEKCDSGRVPKADFARYKYSGTKAPLSNGMQDLLVINAELEDTPYTKSPHSVYVKIRKQDNDGNTLSGAIFKIYDDKDCKHEVGTMVSSNEEWSYSDAITVQAKNGNPSQLWVKEVQAPDGYDPVATAYSITVDYEKNTSRDTAAPLDQIIINGPHTKKSEGAIQKVDAATGEGIGPATFHLEGTTSDGKAYSGDVTSDDEGSVKMQWTEPTEANYIPPGTYTVTETIAPPGYELSSEERTLTLTYDEEHNEVGSSGDIIFRDVGRRLITIKKINDDGEPLDGAVFDVYKDGKRLTSITTVGGVAELSGDDNLGVLPGHYDFIEVKAPAGYVIPVHNVQSVDIPVDSYNGIAEYVLTFTDYTWPELEFEKVEAGTNNLLAGATFEVMVDGRSIGKYTTDVSGRIILTHEQYGKFWKEGENATHTVQVRETEAPAGYLIDDPDWQTLEIIEGQKLAKLTFTDTAMTDIEILKLDSETGEPLEGAVFDVQIEGKSIGDYTTNEDGIIHIDYEKYGKYLQPIENESWTVTVTEKSAPEGHLLSKPSTQTKALTRGMKLLQFEFSDHGYPSIEILKLDANTKDPLAGATYDVQIDGESIGSFTTKNDGKIIIDYENYKRFLTPEDADSWTVTVTETSPPDGHLLSEPKTQSKELKPGMETLQFVFTNYKYPSIEILKLDANTKDPLAGAVYDVQINSRSIGHFTTENNGKITIDYEKYKRFLTPEDAESWTVTVTEVSAPEGHLLSEPKVQTKELVAGMDTLQFEFSNYKQPEIHILKLDLRTNAPVKGAIFEVLINGRSMGDFPTNEEGYIVLTYEDYGKFLQPEDAANWGVTVTEKSPAPNYNLSSPNTQTKTLIPSMTELDFVFKNKHYTTVEVVKRDYEDGRPLAGANFALDSQSLEDPENGGEVHREGVTGEDGILRFENLPNGTYVVKEKIPPDGYLLTDPNTKDVVVNFSI